MKISASTNSNMLNLMVVFGPEIIETACPKNTNCLFETKTGI